MPLRWFIRMSMMLRRPASAARVKLVLGVILVAVLIVALERAGLWPDALTAQKLSR